MLLEKILGNIFMGKLRAICLPEADFNWWLKVIHARRMMHRMRESNVLPIEQGMVKGKTCTDTSMVKQLFFDQANILHKTSESTSTDVGQSYMPLTTPLLAFLCKLWASLSI